LCEINSSLSSRTTNCKYSKFIVWELLTFTFVFLTKVSKYLYSDFSISFKVLCTSMKVKRIEVE
jgi:hypothetical protein